MGAKAPFFAQACKSVASSSDRKIAGIASTRIQNGAAGSGGFDTPSWEEVVSRPIEWLNQLTSDLFVSAGKYGETALKTAEAASAILSRDQLQKLCLCFPASGNIKLVGRIQLKRY